MITAQQKTLKSNFCYIRDIFKTTLDDFLNLRKKDSSFEKDRHVISIVQLENTTLCFSQILHLNVTRFSTSLT